MPAESRKVLDSTERKPLAAARAMGPVPRDERFEVTVRVRRRTPIAQLVAGGQHAAEVPAKRKYVSREEYAAQHGADPADIDRIEQFAREYGLVVVGSSAARRSVFLSGTAAQFEAAFGTRIEHYECDGGTYRGRTGKLSVPSGIGDIVEGVFGIDDRPVARAHFQRLAPVVGNATPRAGNTSFTPPQIAKLYDFPTGADGSGQCIALIELGGGFRPADITTYFKELGIPKPNVTAVRVDGGTNHPTDANSADGEVMLDIEVAAAVAPKAHIVVYFAPNSDKGFLDAITMAIHDTTNKPSVISISWGGPEKNWTQQALTSFDAAFQTAAALGVTVCCASGDAGSGDEDPDALAQMGETPDGLAHVDFPSSSPFALACGGTKIVAANGKITSEVVWNEDPKRSATGGGVSDAFPLPAYQNGAGVPASANPNKHKGRGVPDIAGDADPATGFRIRVDGVEGVFGGTSAVAPLWAGLVALCNQKLSTPVGFLNPLLYGPHGGKAVCRDVTQGNNGAYHAKAGWDPCTGWGSPEGSKLLAALKGAGTHAASSMHTTATH